MPAQRKTPTTPRAQKVGGPVVVDQPGNPRFGEEVAPRRIDRRVLTMAQEPAPSRATRNTMDPFPERPEALPKRGRLSDMEPPKTARGNFGEESGPGYLRIRLGVDGDEARVRGVKFVEGPLQRPTTVSAGLSYEATVGRRRVAVGDVPEFTEHRSFPDPSGRPGMDGHHIEKVPSPEFTVRIPADAITEEELSDLRVDLLRWRGRGPGEHIEVTELAKEPKTALTRVARLSGVDAATLPAAARRSLRAAAERRS